MAGERCLIAEGPPIPSPVCLSYGPIRNVEQLSEGTSLSTSLWQIREPGNRSSSAELQSEKGIFREHFLMFQCLKKEIRARADT
ncbi:hypothetical protein CEXT_75421 [Caerostris extrusa]|uniref:Uncharacterized protein n=1 Tax=Caerostris extrusa TaxID=172846 RepID=A0AAV4NEX8_CAEEX|nr:hypothetical protein CEXT_75421 [Caerostris extrusa]